MINTIFLTYLRHLKKATDGLESIRQIKFINFPILFGLRKLQTLLCMFLTTLFKCLAGIRISLTPQCKICSVLEKLNGMSVSLVTTVLNLIVLVYHDPSTDSDTTKGQAESYQELKLNEKSELTKKLA